MKKSLLASFTILFLLAVFLEPDALTASRQQEETSVAISKMAKDSTVFIKTDGGTGSGFVIANEYVATHHRVIAEAKSINVRLIGSSEEMEGALVVDDTKNNLAIIRVQSLKAPPLILGGNSRLEQGSKVYVYGNPQGLEGSFSSGEVASTWGNKFIQITAPISSGLSGGPVLDSRGHVIGVTVASNKGQNLTLVIPIFHLIELARGKVELPGRVECSHRISCVHQMPCVHQAACDHRVPCSHRARCVHMISCMHMRNCQHLDRGPYGLQAAHPEGHPAHAYDLLHDSDPAHPFDTLHAFHPKHLYDYAHEFDTQHEYDYVTP